MVTWVAWWHLDLTLMLTPESSEEGDELNYFITNMPGWATVRFLRSEL